MNRNTIAVVGATSAPVRGLVHAILGDKAGRFAARVITLDVNTAPAAALGVLGAELVVGHIGASVGLQRGFDGAYGAFYFRPVLNPPALQKELAEIAAMAQAAKDAGVKHFIWATLGDAKDEIEKAFKSVGVPATVLHTLGNLTALRRESGGEELGRLAYGIFKSGEYIGQTVPIKAEVLIEKRRGGVREPMASTSTPPASALGITAEAQAPPAFAAPVGVGMLGPPRAKDGEITKPMTGLPSVTAGAPAVPASRRRRVRPWMAIPLLAAIALFGVEFLRRSRQPDPSTLATDSPGPAEVPRPRSHMVEAIEAHDPPVPTVTSRWEQERAAAKRAAAAGKIVGMPTIAPPSIAAKHIRQKRRDGPHHREEAGEGPLPSPPPKSSGPPEAPVAAAETSAPEGATRPAVSSSGTVPAARAVRPESPAPVALTPGSISSRAVAATVREHAAEVRACFDRAVMERPDLHGRLAIRATVDPKGSVVSVSPTSTIEAGGRLEACVVSAFRTWAFPKPAGGVKGDISYSFSFE